ncbi:hypothetical protein HU749_020885 [Pseudomonas ogarae]|uniref:hypothetical protein n=1 Tax=Pseudomonas ogarae (strain DSM 112162 / CECT 30235 / F113) TaxID=1114970 RepID=UPI0016479B3E|nr:hypothetical protein [Pseudomonas zarinae]QXH97725.1 hypothetical protein HU749_020885 [Pseudomonas zarinae]
MTSQTQDKDENDSSGTPVVNDPGNEDPGSLMDDAQVPLIEEDETPEYPLPSPTNSLSRDQRPPNDDEDVEATPDDPDIAGEDASGKPS